MVFFIAIMEQMYQSNNQKLEIYQICAGPYGPNWSNRWSSILLSDPYWWPLEENHILDLCLILPHFLPNRGQLPFFQRAAIYSLDVDVLKLSPINVSFKVVLAGYRRCPDSHDLSDCSVENSWQSCGSPAGKSCPSYKFNSLNFESEKISVTTPWDHLNL